MLPGAISDYDKHSPGENSSIWVASLQESESFNETGGIAQWLAANLLLDPAAPSSIPSIPKTVSEEKVLMLLKLINGAGQRKMDSGLQMLINPI